MNAVMSETSGIKPITTVDTDECICLTPWEIRSLLPVYHEDAIFLREAVLQPNSFAGIFDTFRHPFTKRNPKHLTREHVLVFVTQASYVFTSHLCCMHPEWGISPEAFQHLAIEEQSTFTRIVMRFKKFIRNMNGIRLNMECVRARVMGERIFLVFSFDLPDGCSGLCEGFISRGMTLRIGDSI